MYSHIRDKINTPNTKTKSNWSITIPYLNQGRNKSSTNERTVLLEIYLRRNQLIETV